MGLMINAGRNIMGYYHHVKAGDWDRSAFPVNLSLNHKTVGLLGGGNIGRQVARRVQAFGASVRYYDTFRLKPEMEEQFHMTYVDLETLLKTSDVVSVHVPLLDSTRHIIGAEQLAMMKKGALLINTARGGLVDDAALLAAAGERPGGRRRTGLCGGRAERSHQGPLLPGERGGHAPYRRHGQRSGQRHDPHDRQKPEGSGGRRAPGLRGEPAVSGLRDRAKRRIIK